MNKIFYLVFILLMIFGRVKARDGYNIQIRINGYPDSALLLTTYYGDRVLLVDTAYAGKQGSFVFEGDSLLPGGIYMAVSQKKNKLFEFIVSDDQQFKLTTDTLDYVMRLSATGSVENQLFFDYVRQNENFFRQSRWLRDSANLYRDDPEKFRVFQARSDSVRQQMADYKLNIIREHPDSFIASLLGAMREVEIPDSLLHTSDSMAAIRYYKNHYWETTDLTDARLLHTPLLAKKVDQYFRQLVTVHPDSVIDAIDEVIGRAKPDREMVSWLAWHFLSEYQNPEYMGFDVMFIHLADNYFNRETILNATPSVLQNIMERADKMRPLVLGSPAPNLILIDTIGNYQSFSSLTNEYVILFFWDYDCGICKNEMKALKNLLANTRFDIGVFAINVNSDLDKWKSAIAGYPEGWTYVNATRSVTQDYHELYNTHSTPVVVVLDAERNIIARQIGIEQLTPFLEHHEQLKKK